jgi:hypothetical protein
MIFLRIFNPLSPASSPHILLSLFTIIVIKKGIFTSRASYHRMAEEIYESDEFDDTSTFENKSALSEVSLDKILLIQGKH